MNIYTDAISASLGIRPIQEYFPDFNFNAKPDDSSLDKRAWFDWTGKNHTEETKELCRQAKLGELNPQFGKSLPDDHPFKRGYNKGLKFSEDRKEKMRQAKLNKSKSFSHKEAMSEAHRQRLAEKVCCPHCNKYCSKYHWATAKYHFDNCKHNK